MLFLTTFYFHNKQSGKIYEKKPFPFFFLIKKILYNKKSTIQITQIKKNII